MYIDLDLTNGITKSAVKDGIDSIWYQASWTKTGDALWVMTRDVFSTNRGMRADSSVPKV